MSGKGIVRLVLLAFVAVSLGWFISKETADEPDAADTVQAPEKERQVTAYYFHRTARCKTCLKIEDLSKTGIATGFAAELSNGDLAFQSLNVEAEGNEHFVEDYELVSQALVLVDYRNGVPGKWKSLDRTWELVHSDDEFKAYVRDEVRAFLETL